MPRRGDRGAAARPGFYVPGYIADRMFGLQDGEPDRTLLAAGKRIQELDSHRLEQLSVAIAAGQRVGLVGGLDSRERSRLAKMAASDGVDPSDRDAVLAWLREHPKAPNAVMRLMRMDRGHVSHGRAASMHRWDGRL